MANIREPIGGALFYCHKCGIGFGRKEALDAHLAAAAASAAVGGQHLPLPDGSDYLDVMRDMDIARDM